MALTITRAKPIDWIRAYQNVPPVDVKQMATDLGVNIWEMENMPPDASGKLFPDPRSFSGYSIGVNVNDSYTRKRFTIAHELAHFLLHKSLIRDGILDDTLYRSQHLSGAQETEANKFAADILMPYHLLESLAAGGLSVQDLARKFGVSTQAMSIRLGIPLP